MTNWLERLIGETQAKLLVLLRRAPRSIAGLSDALHVTDNAVRTHVAALDRHGLVAHVGTQRDTGGKPARVYSITSEAEELFPKAYALVLGGLVDELNRTNGRERTADLLRLVGRRAAEQHGRPADPEEGARAATVLLQSLGADIELQRTDAGWLMQGYGCPLSKVTAGHPEVCELVKAIVAEVVGVPVTECCDRSGRPRCAFKIDAAHAT